MSLSIELKEKDEMLLIELPDWGIQLVIEPLTDTLGLIRGLAQDRGGAVQIVMVDGQEHIQLWGDCTRDDSVPQRGAQIDIPWPSHVADFGMFSKRRVRSFGRTGRF